MLSCFRPSMYSLLRCRLYSTAQTKVPAKLIGELRKLTEVSIIKAREALAASNNDVNLAIQWLQKDLAISGAAKAAKLEGRATGEGLVSTCVLSRGYGPRSGPGSNAIRAAMVELNCETDFVGRNELFGKLAADIAHTAASLYDPPSQEFFGDCPLDFLSDAPLISQLQPGLQTGATVGSSIRALISRVGEKVSLRRAVTMVAREPAMDSNIGLRVASYNHGSTNNSSQGRIGTLALIAMVSPRLSELFTSAAFSEELGRLERSLARQITGLETTSIAPTEGQDEETALLCQEFLMLTGNRAGATVKDVLQSWSVEKGLIEKGRETSGGLTVYDFRKWSVGEPLPFHSI